MARTHGNYMVPIILVQTALRAVFRPLSLIAPSLAGRLAVRVFCRTPPRRSSERVTALLAAGDRATVTVRGRTVAVWAWGQGPRVMLVHGWGGVGGQLATFVPALLERGYSVATFDAPGHGASQGHESSLLHFADAIIAVHQRLGPTHAIVAHSLGAGAATLAMTHGVDVHAAVFLGPPSHPRNWTEIFARRVGLSNAAIDRMRHHAEREFQFDWDDIDTATLATRLQVPLLILHDADDDEVPIAQGRELANAWPDARFVATRGLGHRRILSELDVIRQAADFLATSAPVPAALATHS